MEIFEKAGIDSGGSNKGGINLDDTPLIDAINAFLDGYSAINAEGWSGSDLEAHFANGGVAIGYLEAPVLNEYGQEAGEVRGHMLEVIGVDRDTLEHQTYDPVSGEYRNFDYLDIDLLIITRN